MKFALFLKTIYSYLYFFTLAFFRIEGHLHYGSFSVRANTEAQFANISKITCKNFINLNF